MARCERCERALAAEARERWIPVTERLPTKRGKVLAYYPDKYGCEISMYTPRDQGWESLELSGWGNELEWTRQDVPPTHWLPLPAPPEVEP